MSGEAFSTYLIVHVNSLNKIFIILNSKNISTYINNLIIEYNNYLTT